MSNDHEIRRDAIVESITEQLRTKLIHRFPDFTKAAEESYTGDERLTQPLVKLACSIEFGAEAAATPVKVRLAWAARYADESEENVDPRQSKLGLPDEVTKACRVAAKELVADARKQGLKLSIIPGGKEATS